MAKTYQQIMKEAQQLVPEVSPDETRARLEGAKKPVVLDVREREEVRQGYVPGALAIPRGYLEMRVEEALPDKGTPIIAYCAGGTRSLLAGRIRKAFSDDSRSRNSSTRTSGLRAWRVRRADSVFGMPMRSLVWRIWRCRFDKSTTSMSTRPMVPTPAAAR